MRRPAPSSPRPEPLRRDYLITIWRTRQDPIVQTLLLEIARLHAVVREVEDCRAIMAAELRSQGGGQLAAAHRMRTLLSSEPALTRPPARPRAAPAQPEPDPMFPPGPPYDPAIDAK